MEYKMGLWIKYVRNSEQTVSFEALTGLNEF
jgi:hypothetical protein